MRKFWLTCLSITLSACSVNETITTRKQTGSSQTQSDPTLIGGPTSNYSSYPNGTNSSNPSGTPTGNGSSIPTPSGSSNTWTPPASNPSTAPVTNPSDSGSSNSNAPTGSSSTTPTGSNPSSSAVAMSTRAVNGVTPTQSAIALSGISSSINNGVNTTSCTPTNGACPTPVNCDMNDQCQLVLRGDNLAGATATLLYAGNSYPLLCPDPTSSLTSNANTLTCRPPTSGGIFSSNGPFDLQLTSPNGTVTITNVLRNGYYGH